MKIVVSRYIIISFFLLSFTLCAQTISSNAGGGNWSSSSTWVGGIVPASTNDVVINGPVTVDINSTVKNLTINSGGLIEHDGNYWKEIFVNGDVINNGTIRNKPGAYYGLTLYVYKNVTNNAVMKDFTLDYKSDLQNQTISGSSAYACKIMIEGFGEVRALSNIRLDSLGYFQLGDGDSLIMGSYKLTIDERTRNVSESYGNGSIVSNGELEINGLFGCNLDGNFVLTGNKPLQVYRNFTVYHNLTVGQGKVFEHDGNYWEEIFVNGDVINNGTIRNKPDSYYGLTLYVYKNVTNNAVMKDITLDYKSNLHDQTISGSSTYGCKIIIEGSGEVRAASNIRLDSLGYFQLYDGDSLMMGNYKLTIDERTKNASESSGDGRIVSDGELEINGLFGCNLDGNFVLTGSKPLQVYRNFTVFHNLTIGQGKVVEHDGNYWEEITVKGDIINNGIIRNMPGAYYGLTLYAFKNILNKGQVTNSLVVVKGNETRNISGDYFDAEFEFNAPKVVLLGDLKCKSIRVTEPYTINGGSSVFSNNLITGWEKINNFGKICCKLKVDDNWYGYDYGRARIWLGARSGIDSLIIESAGNQVPHTFSGALKNIWRIKPPQNISANFSTIQFIYNHGEFGNNSENNLELFHSVDSGKTWKQISVSTNTTRYPDQDIIEFKNIPANGEYVLSSNPDPVSVRANICVSIIGRDRIRMGGVPNRYTINYYNNSDVTTGEILMRIGGQQGIFIKSVEPSVPAGAPKLDIPVDSITYDGIKDTIYLFVSPMSPREVRSFDVIFTADNTLAKPNEAAILPLIGVVLWWGVAAITTAYVTDVTMNVSENIWQPVGCRSVSEALNDVLYESWQQTNKDWFCYEKPARVIAESAAEEMLKRGAGVAIPGKNIVEGAGRSMKGMERYLKGDFNVVTDCNGKRVNPEGDASTQELGLKKVTSWDPNEKTGPKGTGDKNFITSAGRIPYRIFFENKKEAQAPAWKILIVDTLAGEFDPETVVFEKKSHEGALYSWQIDKQFNPASGRNDILRWYIEGIELPPNVNPPEGEGYVSFSVESKKALQSGTTLLNSATITFDINSPISTNVWQNTLDFTAPVTTLNVLPTESKNNKLLLRWNADDGSNGSGINTTAVYGKRNDGGYEILGTSMSDSLLVDVSSGVYSFYALSKDNAGNVETQYNNLVTTVVTDIKNETNIPENYVLYQNYPNPFNPSTTIKFALPAESNVRIEVFDIIGQRVAVLIDRTEKPGYYNIGWNASSFASGIYLIRLKAKAVDGQKSFRDIKKVLLLK